MTQGSLYRNIFRFRVPLFISNLLQVIFNMSDIAVVGRFAGSAALGSVGSCAILTALFTGLLIGLGSGINAIAARYIGAGDKDKTQKTVHCSLMISLLYGVLVTVVGLLSAKGLLVLLNTKAELLDGAVLYLMVYLLGTPALAVYNYGNGILSAGGDSKRPLYYLLAAGILNIVLNLFFVIVCRMNVLGVALASVISQYLSAILILMRLLTCKEDYALSIKKIGWEKEITKTVLLLGLPAGLQNAIFSLANLFIQAAVNSFDTVMVAGNSAAANADSLIYGMMSAFYVACTTFMGQNYGAGEKGPDAEKLYDQYALRFPVRPCRRSAASFIWQTVFVPVYRRTGGNRGGNETAFHYGRFLLRFCLYGLHNRGRQRNWKNRSADCCGNNGFLRVPDHMDLYGFCIFSYHSVAVSAVCVFLAGDSHF